MVTFKVTGVPPHSVPISKDFDVTEWLNEDPERALLIRKLPLHGTWAIKGEFLNELARQVMPGMELTKGYLDLQEFEMWLVHHKAKLTANRAVDTLLGEQ